MVLQGFRNSLRGYLKTTNSSKSSFKDPEVFSRVFQALHLRDQINRKNVHPTKLIRRMHHIIIESIFIFRASLKFGCLLKQSILKQSSFFCFVCIFFFISTPHDYCSNFFRSCPFFATTFFNRHIIIFSFFAHQHHVPYKRFFLLSQEIKENTK